MNSGRVPIPVGIDLDADAARWLLFADASLDRCHETLTASLSRLVSELGLPAEPSPSLAIYPDAQFPVEIAIAGSPGRSARQIAAQSLYWAGVAGLPMGQAASLSTILMSISDPATAARALAAAVTEAVHRDAELLITPQLTRLWAATAGLPDGWDPATVLRYLVRLGLPPGTGAEIAVALREHPAGSVAGLEAAVAVRAAEVWKVLVPPALLREITADALRNPDLFRQLRESFYEQTGVRLPKAALAADPSLPADAISFRIFGVTGPIVITHDAAQGRPGVTAANDDSAGAAAAAKPTASIDGTGEESPAGSGPGELIARALGLLAMDRIEALITTASTTEELDRFGMLYPKLRSLISAIPLPIVTRLFRALVAGGVSIQNLPLILQAVLDYHERLGVVTDEAELLHQVRARSGWPVPDGSAVADGRRYGH